MQLKEFTELRNKRGIFTDRNDAGARLAELMPEYEGRDDCLVLAIPSGGVPVGVALAHALQLPLDVVIARKLQIPGNTEAGFGALALEGGRFLNENIMAALGLSEKEIEQETQTVAAELSRRNQLLRGGRPLPELQDRVAVLVDDGLASGFTMLAALDAVRSRKPREIVVAVPTAPLSSIHRLEGLAQVVFCANVHEHKPFAVAAAYTAWRDLETAEVRKMLSG